MKRIFSRLLIASLTLFIGITAATVRKRLSTRSAVSSSDSSTKADSVDASWRRLLTFEDQNLRTLSDKQLSVLQETIISLVGVQEDSLLPRVFSKIINAKGEYRYVLVRESPLRIIPGGCGLRIDAFSLDGQLLNSSAFGSGWRIGLESMRFVQVDGLAGDLLEVNSQASINGRDIAKQYYGLVGERMLLVRLEDSSGELIPNYYSSPNHTIGSTSLGWSMNDWHDKLNSGDYVEVLAALTWIGGVHLSPEAFTLTYSHEELADVRMAADLRASETIKSLVKGLVRVDHHWIRDAAKLTEKSLGGK
jgi:hypothetical protein